MPDKGDLYVETAAPSTVYEIVRFVETPAGVVLLSGSTGAFAVREVGQAAFAGQYARYAPPFTSGDQWVDDQGRVFVIDAAYTIGAVQYVAIHLIDDNEPRVLRADAVRSRSRPVV